MRVYPDQFPFPSRRPHAAEFPSVRRPESLSLFQGVQALVHQPRVPLMQLVARIRAIVHGQGRTQPVSHRDFCAALQLLMDSRHDSTILAIPFQARLLNDDRVLPADLDSLRNVASRVDHGGGGGGPCVQDRNIYARVEQPLNSGDPPIVRTVCIPKSDLEQARVLVDAKFVCSEVEWFSAGQTLPFVTEGLLHASAANVAHDELLQAKASARRAAPTSVVHVPCVAGVSREPLPYALVMPQSPDDVCIYFEHPFSEALTFSCSAGRNSFSFTDTFVRQPLVSISLFPGPSAKISAWTSSLSPYTADLQVFSSSTCYFCIAHSFSDSPTRYLPIIFPGDLFHSLSDQVLFHPCAGRGQKGAGTRAVVHQARHPLRCRSPGLHSRAVLQSADFDQERSDVPQAMAFLVLQSRSVHEGLLGGSHGVPRRTSYSSFSRSGFSLNISVTSKPLDSRCISSLGAHSFVITFQEAWGWLHFTGHSGSSLVWRSVMAPF